MALEFKTMTKEDIGEWCKANGAEAVAWIKAKAREMVDKPIYPKVKNEKGKMVDDKTQEPIGTKKVKISMVQLKIDFCRKYMPEILPASHKKLSMYDYFESL